MKTDAKQPKGIIGRTYREGLPVIWKFVNEPPSPEVKELLPWLTILSWSYDGSGNNGMPIDVANRRMVLLEQAIAEGLEGDGLCQHSISRTGGNLKELIYYACDRDLFTERLNIALRAHERYPIEINFYHDPDWTEHTNTCELFRKD